MMRNPTSSRTPALPPNIICSAWPSALRERKVKPKDDIKHAPPRIRNLILVKCLLSKTINCLRLLLAANHLQPIGTDLQKIVLDPSEQMQTFFAGGLSRKAGLDDTDVELEAVILPHNLQLLYPGGRKQAALLLHQRQFQHLPTSVMDTKCAIAAALHKSSMRRGAEPSPCGLAAPQRCRDASGC